MARHGYVSGRIQPSSQFAAARLVSVAVVKDGVGYRNQKVVSSYDYSRIPDYMTVVMRELAEAVGETFERPVH